MHPDRAKRLILWFDQITIDDVPLVGGKNASHDEILTLSRWACIIEDNYGKPMYIEWAKDCEHGELFIVQARPETVHSLQTEKTIETYVLKETGKVILIGQAVGGKIDICGQAPSDFPEFATFLVECSIDSISLIPDTVVKTGLAVANKERELGMEV